MNGFNLAVSMAEQCVRKSVVIFLKLQPVHCINTSKVMVSMNWRMESLCRMVWLGMKPPTKCITSTLENLTSKNTTGIEKLATFVSYALLLTKNIFFIFFISILIFPANERVVIDFSNNGKNAGFLPDGLTIDTDGNLYITNFGGSNVVIVEPK